MAVAISIIVATYKAEPFLSRFLTSVCRQVDALGADVEIICVDDCSPDRSSDVIRQFQGEYDFLHLVRHPQNKGAAAARNTGLDNACGEYVLFVDPDDLLPDDALQTLMGIIRDHHPDIIRFQYQIVSDKGIPMGISKSRARGYINLEADRTSLRAGFEDVALGMNTPDGCYRVAAAPSVRQNSRFVIAEDRHYGWECFRQAKTVYCCPQVLYQYFQNAESITHNVTRAGIEGVLALNEVFWNEARTHTWYADVGDLMYRRLVPGLVGWQFHEVFDVRPGDVALRKRYFQSVASFVQDFSGLKVQPVAYWLLKIAVSMRSVALLRLFRIWFRGMSLLSRTFGRVLRRRSK